MYDDLIFVFVYICCFGLSDLFLEYFKIKTFIIRLVYYCSFGIIALIMIHNRNYYLEKQ